MKSDVVYKKFADIVKINHREDQYLTIAPLNMTHTILIRFHIQIPIQSIIDMAYIIFTYQDESPDQCSYC